MWKTLPKRMGAEREEVLQGRWEKNVRDNPGDNL